MIPATVNGRLSRHILLGLAIVPAILHAAYSPPVADDYPDRVYWGDTHLHTYLSGDAFGMGTRLTPDDAYRFARGETVLATGGEPAKLRRPLDFLLIADHAESLGVLPMLTGKESPLRDTPEGVKWAEYFAAVPALKEALEASDLDSFIAISRRIMAGKAAWNADFGVGAAQREAVWRAVIDAAERHNAPGVFTTFVGYEYSSNPPMRHRNVLFAGGPEETRQTVPFSKYDSPDPEDLWRHLEGFRARTGGDVIAIPHNGNLSGGRMFSPVDSAGRPLTADQATRRAALEPIAEVTQIKGDSETHPLVSPEDPFADYETWGGGPYQAREGGKNRVTGEDKPGEWAKRSYLRPALKAGLRFEAQLGANPFKLGMIGSTDSHNGLATAAEDNFWGKMGENEPSPYRIVRGAIFAASGYAAVWAKDNTRSEIFAALKRREVYATTGPRIELRFFGGWHFESTAAESPRLAAIGYAGGVPMGGDLSRGETGAVPSFLIRAVKDPVGANLDRVQVIKGWTHGGNVHERVYDVAWSGNRSIGPDGQLRPVASTVDVERATYSNRFGAAELAVVWTDPDFDPAQHAFYYVRVVEIPTPRWTAYDIARFGLTEWPANVPLVTQERAYSSPIWYTP